MYQAKFNPCVIQLLPQNGMASTGVPDEVFNGSYVLFKVLIFGDLVAQKEVGWT